MRSALVCIMAVIVILTFVAGSIEAKVATRYEVMKVPSDEVQVYSIDGISNSGVIYGSATSQRTQENGVYRYSSSTGAMEFTSQLQYGWDINSGGSIAGVYSQRNGCWQYCVWNADGTMLDLPLVNTPYYSYADINDSGQVLGYQQVLLPNGMPKAENFIWSSTAGMAVPILPSDLNSWMILNMNNNGYYLGTTHRIVTPGPGHPYIGEERVFAVWSEDGNYAEINEPDRCVEMTCDFINDHNQTAGDMKIDDQDHVFLWDSVGGAVDVTAGIDGWLYCTGMNNRGQVLIDGFVEYGDNTAKAHYIWDSEDGLVDVHSLIDSESGWILGHFKAINDEGWIVTDAWNTITQESGDIILRPITTPEPGGVLAVLIGLVGLIGRTIKRQQPR